MSEYESENKKCQNCKQDFTIESEDFEFYKKMRVPPPTFCPECRLIRRMIFKNMRAMYKRSCNLCGANIISLYSSSTPFPVYCQVCWWSDKWDALNYGSSFDFSKPFFEQYKELLNKVPRISLNTDYLRSINSDYANYAGPLKNCYLVFQAEDDENCMYSSVLLHSRDSADCVNASRVVNTYEVFNCDSCYNTYFSVSCVDCSDVYFSKNLRNCTNCFGCNNLRYKNYCVFNKEVGKEEYADFIKQFNKGSYKEIKGYKNKADLFWQIFPNKYFYGMHNNNVTGDYITNSKNVLNSFEINGGENLKYCFQAHMPTTKDCYDYGDWGNNASLCYEAINCGENITDVKFSLGSWIGGNWQYCDTVVSNNHMFGCISLRKGKYCILNKQYTKEEYEQLVPQIINHMNEMPYISRAQISSDDTQTNSDNISENLRNNPRKSEIVYKYGEFFPPELSPFAYNETIAQEYFPLTKEQAIEQGYKWKDPEERNIPITLQSQDLPDHIKDVDDSILQQVIECEHKGTCNEQCTTAFKIIKSELDFYRKMNLPLPRLCPNCRHYQRIKQRNPLKLWHRKCMCNGSTSSPNNNSSIHQYNNTVIHTHGIEPCPNEFETTYSPDRPEIVYCESCYNSEVV